MTDLEMEHGTVTTGATTADIVISGFTDAQGGFLRITPAADGTEDATCQTSHCYFDVSNTTGVEAFRNGSTHRGRHRSLTTTLDTFWSRNSSGTSIVDGYAVLTATDLTLKFSSSVVGHVIEYGIYTGAGVQATAFANVGSPLVAGFQPNIIHAGLYTAVNDGQSTAFSRFWTGMAVGSTLVQHGLTAIPEDEETILDSTQWMAKPFTLGSQSTITALTSTGATYDIHGGPVVGLAVETGGSVALKTFTIPSTAVATDTVAMPDAGFDDVGFMLSMAGCAALDTDDTTRACMSLGYASPADQRTHLMFHDSSDALTVARTGQFVTSMQADTTRVEYRCSIDSVQRTPTLTVNTAGGHDLGVSVLYVQIAAATAARRTRMML